MVSKSLFRLATLLVVFFVLQQNEKYSVHSAALDFIKDAAKTVANKAADAADKTEPAAETGGVRATALHTGANLIIDKTFNVIGNKYPVVAPALPMMKKLAKPALKAMHERINSFGRKKDEVTAEVEVKPEEKPADDKAQQSEEKPAGKEVEVDQKVDEKAAEESEKKDKKSSHEDTQDEKKKADEEGAEKKEADGEKSDEKKVDGAEKDVKGEKSEKKEDNEVKKEKKSKQ